MNEYEFSKIESPEPRRSCLKTALYLGIVFVLIVGLLGTAISGVTWLVKTFQSQEETAVSPPTTLSESSPNPTPDSALAINRIVFINNDGQVETIAPDGKDQRQISDESIQFLFPAWSPTGEYIAAIGGRSVFRLADSLEADVQELYTSRSQNPFYLYWSPNGRFLTFLANHPRGIGLYLTPVDGGEDESRLLDVGSPFYWDWTADSAQILMHTGLSGDGARLALLDVENGRSGPNVALPGLFQVPDISANGHYWAYSKLDENGISWIVAADSNTGQEHLQRHAGQAALGWSPTSDQLAFISGGEGRLDFAGPLRLMDSATGEVRLLNRETVLAYFWSPDGRFLAAITGEDGLRGVIAEGNGRRFLGKPASQHPTITLNLILINVVSGEKRHLLTFEPTQTFITQFLPYFDQYALSHRLWSPSSDALVLPVQKGDANQITIIPINGDSPRQIAAGDMSFWSQH